MAKKKNNQPPITQVTKVLKLRNERQAIILDTISEHAKPDVDFYLLSVFSSIIITLGLIRDNTAVVIGGMLIAPFIWPILQLALGVVRGQPISLRKGLMTALKAALIFVAVSYIITVVWPVFEVGREILQRTEPTLAELVIALSSGFIGAFIISWPKIISALGGVLIAAAITPPLGVLGITLALGNFEAFMGAFLLFLANLIAITFGAAILFFLIKIRPLKSEKTPSRVMRNTVWAVIFFVLITIPLSYFFIDIAKINRQKFIIQDVIEENMPESVIRDLQVSHSQNSVHAKITVEYTEEVTEWKVDRINDIISDKLNKSVDLEMYIVPVIKAGETNNTNTEQLL